MEEQYRFSPIKTEKKLFEAIEYTHFVCFELCKKAFGEYLPVVGNIGIFCHYDDEFKFLKKLRKRLTKESKNWNQKYFYLHKPITIKIKNNVPETTYTYLYIRKPDQHTQVGDVDFIMSTEEHNKLKNITFLKNKINDVEIFYRPDLDMIRLSNSNIDALAYISTKTMDQNMKESLNKK